VDDSEYAEQSLLTRLDALAAQTGFTVQPTGPEQPERLIPLKPDLFVPDFASGRVTSKEFPGVVFDMDIRWDVGEVRYRMHRLAISSDGGISTADMHRFSIPRLTTAMAAGEVLIDLGNGSMARFELALEAFNLPELRKKMAVDGPTPETLQWVARIYAWTVAMGGSPNKMVTSLFELPQRTSTRWIARARADGHLDV
jgi:hypothetical protein